MRRLRLFLTVLGITTVVGALFLVRHINNRQRLDFCREELAIYRRQLSSSDTRSGQYMYDAYTTAESYFQKQAQGNGFEQPFLFAATAACPGIPEKGVPAGSQIMFTIRWLEWDLDSAGVKIDFEDQDGNQRTARFDLPPEWLKEEKKIQKREPTCVRGYWADVPPEVIPPSAMQSPMYATVYLRDGTKSNRVPFFMDSNVQE